MSDLTGKPISKEEFEKLGPYSKGYVSYWQGAWNTDISEENPYPHGSKDWKDFRSGQHNAAMAAQEGDDG